MSVALMALAWKTALPMNTKMTMLALADWANDDGQNIHPSIYALAEKVSCSERTAQRLLRELEQEKWIAVVGNHNGGMPGATRRYRINVRKLKEQAEQEDARRAQERTTNRHTVVQEPDPFADDDGCQIVTPDKLARVTNEAETGDKSRSRRVTNEAATGDASVTQSTIDTTIDTTIEPPYSVALPRPAAKPQRGKAADPELQTACRAVWAAYSDAFARRYGTAPVRNAKVNANVVQLVKRLGGEEAAQVARFYVERVNEAWVVRDCHSFGVLLAKAEAYRTQWASGRTVTATQARQVDRMQANASAAEGAMAILLARRAEQQAQGNVVDVEARAC